MYCYCKYCSMLPSGQCTPFGLGSKKHSHVKTTYGNIVFLWFSHTTAQQFRAIVHFFYCWANSGYSKVYNYRYFSADLTERSNRHKVKHQNSTRGMWKLTNMTLLVTISRSHTSSLPCFFSLSGSMTKNPADRISVRTVTKSKQNSHPFSDIFKEDFW